MEYLSMSLNGPKEDKTFKYHPKCAKLGITHLSFADDLLLFSRGHLPSIAALHRCFSQFSQTSGLQANLGKSFVYFEGVSQTERSRILQHFGYVQGELTFRYLGIPLSTKKISLMQWQPLIQKIVARVSSWTTKKLSYAGRVQLVQSILFGIWAYWAQLFPLHIKVLKLIDGYCRSYVWSADNNITKKSLVAWEKLCTPKSVGGLNLVNLQL
uniref:Reverse transcriptase domain-containing protein n=1 Tax=Nicotiana tabacum TaxID=4097 RepID=A0A1S4BWL2_TOBAC|nr:PREDICTED: uncharacterized protein LOC107812650 [Nicotiana tabacum]